MSLLRTIKMMNEMCVTLTQMERNGIKIDLQALDELEVEYKAEYELLTKELNMLAQEAMGDTPINLNSPAQLSTLVYSRKIKDKKLWAEKFELDRTRPKAYSPKNFARMVNGLTEVTHKTKASQCKDCKGYGKFSKLRKKDNTYGPRKWNCKGCGGSGVCYATLKPVAGFAMTPKSVYDVSTLGFITNKEKLEELANVATEPAKTFLTKLVRFNAVSVYLSSFIGGIRKNVRGDGVLHTQFMQCVAATARLSSRDPNFHNQPRGETFPIRRVVVSRFKGGIITDADYGQLEFRVAAELSGCKVAEKDILDGVDVHARTADTLTRAGQRTSRQDAKEHTFKPLYGGSSGTPAEQKYYAGFLQRYIGVRDWHDKLLSEVLANGYLRLPSGREYRFPWTRRYPSGGVSNATKIKNYPVQGFATADIVPVATIALQSEYQRRRVRSRLINEVHDSLVTDTHPDEKELILEINKEVLLSVPQLIWDRYGYQMTIPLVIEIKQGVNWLAMETMFEG